jgi:hypothetical protein
LAIENDANVRPNAGASLCDFFLPIGWALSLQGRIPRRPNHDPLRAPVTDELERGINSRVTRTQLPPALSKAITNDLDRDVLNLPIAHLDLLVA